jgi:hypothetical protein
MGVCEAGVEPQGLPELLYGFIQPPLPGIDYTQVIMGLGKAGFKT